MGLLGGYSALHTEEDALRNELPSQGPILQPLPPLQFQVQLGLGGFHPFQDVGHTDQEGVGPVQLKKAKNEKRRLASSFME